MYNCFNYNGVVYWNAARYSDCYIFTSVENVMKPEDTLYGIYNIDVFNLFDCDFAQMPDVKSNQTQI